MLYSELIQEGRLAVEEMKALTFLIEQRYGKNVPREVMIDLIGFLKDLDEIYRRRCAERWCAIDK